MTHIDEVVAVCTSLWWFRKEVDVLWVEGVRSLVHRPTGIHVPAPKVEFENSKRAQYLALWNVLRIHDRLTGNTTWRDIDELADDGSLWDDERF